MKTLKDILPLVEKPARYTGGEWGEKELLPAKFNYCICFPDVYEVGMSNLGIKIVAEAVRSVEGTCVDRCFAPWPDFGAQLKENKIPLYSLGLKWGLSKFDMLGFSLQYEMSYTAVLYMLELANIPLKACDRGEEYPIIQAGGPCVCNPEPMADFIDIFTIGDGEEVMAELAKLKLECKSKFEFLNRASELDGVYVPALMNVEYTSDGKIAGFSGKTYVKKALVKNLDSAVFPPHFAVANTEAVFDRGIIEVMRGCYRGCRFCQAGFLYRPVRRRSVETLTKQACSIVRHAGFSELSLNSLAKNQGVSAGYLATVFKKETGKTVSEYIKDKRMDYAMYLLNTTHLQIQTIALHCGVMDVQYFCKMFKKKTGKTPKEYRESIRNNKKN